MTAVRSKPIALDCLCDLYPPDCLLHVGAGLGERLRTLASWSVKSAILIEADPGRLSRLETAIADMPGCVARNGLVGERVGEAAFFTASNNNESSLIKPERLSRVWRNLTTINEQERTTTTIEKLLDGEESQKAEAVNWVIIDCLPALDILKGAGSHVENWDVVMARVVLDESLARTNPELGRTSLEAFMAERNFRSLGHEPERNPGFGLLVFVRDWKKKCSALEPRIKANAADLEQANQVSSEAQVSPGSEANPIQSLQSQVDELTRERDTKAQELAASSDRLVTLEQKAKRAEKRFMLAQADLDQLRKQYAALHDRHEKSNTLVRELSVRLDELTQLKQNKGPGGASRKSKSSS
ncbi:MAG: hypothetical protein H6882_03005 [Rhodobiaceae bacterium]|nr:hypothetical protein [Rhodobiaceae bacterium]